ncbi:MAG: hypothetical protein Q9N68_11230 [Gammaproteobacteria bacterium]|nr:hypothetical protein [Gammaproteobacteria bacterium]
MSLEANLTRVLTYACKINTAIVLAAFSSYVLAAYAWSEGQSVGAVVIATLGYLLFRSLGQISFNLTWQHFQSQKECAALFHYLDADNLRWSKEKLLALLQQEKINNSFSNGEIKK